MNKKVIRLFCCWSVFLSTLKTWSLSQLWNIITLITISSPPVHLLTFTVRCTEVPDTGNCRDSLTKWYYNPIGQKCSRFNYGGCQGNENRFDSRDACMKFCRGVSGWLFFNLKWALYVCCFLGKLHHICIWCILYFTRIIFPPVHFHVNHFVNGMSQHCRKLLSECCQYFIPPQAILLIITHCDKGGVAGIVSKYEDKQVEM